MSPHHSMKGGGDSGESPEDIHDFQWRNSSKLTFNYVFAQSYSGLARSRRMLRTIIDRTTRILMYCRYGITMLIAKSGIEPSAFVC